MWKVEQSFRMRDGYAGRDGGMISDRSWDGPLLRHYLDVGDLGAAVTCAVCATAAVSIRHPDGSAIIGRIGSPVR